MELISKKTRNELFSIVHFRIIFIYIVFIPFSICTSITAAEKVYPVGMKLAGNHLGISNMIWKGTLNERNYIDEGKFIGELKLKYSNKIVNSNNYKPEVIVQRNDDIQLLFRLPENVVLKEQFKIKNGSLFWTFEIHNKGNHSINIQDLFFPIPIGVMDTKKQAKDNLSLHYSVNGDASFLYWIPYSGEGEILLATPIDGTSLEYFTFSDNNDYYIHSSTSVDRVNETWRMPSSQLDLASGASKTYGFKFQLVQKTDQVRQAIFNEGGIDVRVVPGMTLPENIESLCAIRIKNKIDKVIAEYPDKTSITKMKGHRDGYNIYHFSFKKLGENQITLIYGKNKKAYLEFFITEPLETLIKKRASFIVSHQQIRDTSKWYDGLFGVWDMKNSILLNPDSKGPLPDFVVGGSDDPSNGKALYVSEKNVIYPNEKEIAALEYYEKEFVWGKLQRTDKEYPYPYGIYGSENWYENRSGRAGFYNSGGCGKERMWRTFDYTTHLALYFNLYKIARDYPDMVKYLDMKGYLERAYRTAMAFFEVPYNIKMGEKWSFHGWCDWAYKQGNFHDRYIVDIIQALEQNGKIEEASNLLREWEKKVKYSIYDDPWPFGSEMFVDRTAYETSYYIAEYAKKNRLLPDEQLWYDKNKQSWYSHPVINDSMTDVFLQKQIDGNLALRGILAPSFNLLGTAWASSYNLDYMSQMGGAAILDYAINFSKTPAKYINIGYNSILSSWALMNTGEDGIGYWYPNKNNDGAVGWAFNNWQHGWTYFRNISTPRGPWQYDGEIDHGLVGGVHALATYVINDPLFGFIAYGGKLLTNDKRFNVIPLDGVRRKFFLQDRNKILSIEMLQDGFHESEPIIIADNLDRISFIIENRLAKTHSCSFKIYGLNKGNYSILVNGTKECIIEVTKEKDVFYVKFPLKQASASIEIIKF